MEPGQDVLASLLLASTRTWWLSDGRGSLARGTASGAAARRGHALLAAPGVGPRADWPAVALLRFDDRVTPEGGAPFELTPAFVAAPRGESGTALAARGRPPALLESFADLPWPRWRFRGEGWRLEREVRLIEGHPALLATWRLLEGRPLRLDVAPLLVARSLLGLERETPEFRGATTGIPGRVRCGTVEGYAPLTLWHGGAFMPARAWHRGLAYPGDRSLAPTDPDLGEGTPTEDAFLPGWVQLVLAEPGAALHVVASPEEQLFRALAAEQRLGTPPARTLADCIAMLDLAESERRARRHDAAFAGARVTRRQVAEAVAARAAREAGAGREGGAARGVAAVREPGDPNGGDAAPATDPVIALEPATALDPGDGVLVARLAARLHDALLERADRTAVLTHAERGEERGPDALRVAAALVSLREFRLARDIARGYIAWLDEGLAPASFAADGTPAYAGPEASLWLIHVVDLLSRRDDSPQTADWLRDGAYAALEGVLQSLRAGSRNGVRCDRDGFLWWGEGDVARARADLNALWYHALVAMAQLAKRAQRRENAAFYLAWARELQRAFLERFWDEEASTLYGALAPEDVRVRECTPAQLLAVSLPPMLLSPELATRLLATVARELAAPGGLRPRPGDGPVDPEWLGAWAAATRRAHDRDAASARRVREVIERWAGPPAPAAPRRAGRGAPAPSLARVEAVEELGVAGAADLLRAVVEELDPVPAETEVLAAT